MWYFRTGKRSTRFLLVFAAVIAAVAALSAGTTPASAHAHKAGLARTIITVEAHTSIFKMSAKTAPRGVVIFKVSNPSSPFKHDFSINGRTTPILSKGQHATLRVTFLRPGRYTYKCTIVPHASWGQKGVFTIT
jgi:plastocyanin